MLFVIVLFGLIKTVIFFIKNYESKHEVCLEMEQRWKEKEMNGLINLKFIDSTNHNLKTTKYTHKNSSGSWIFAWDYSGLFEFLKEGDFVIKKTNSLEVFVIRDGIKYNFILNPKCERFEN